MADDMPLVMPDGMQVDLDSVDDLFGGELADELALQPLPMPPYDRFRLRMRISELQTKGCRRGVAWSKGGSIATISLDGRSVQLWALRSSHKDASWGLSGPTTCELLAGSSAAPIVHLAWGGSPLSPELAVIDSAGRVAVVQFGHSLNHGALLRRFDQEPIDDSHAVAGCFWLPVMNHTPRPWTTTYGPALRATSDAGVHHYQYQTGFTPVGLVFPSNSKGGLVTVTANGLLRLMWNGGRIPQPEVATVELGSIMGLEGAITHASIAIEKQTLLVAVAKSKGQLWLFQVSINWNAAQDYKTSNLMRPILTAKCLCRTVWSRPMDEAAAAAEGTGVGSMPASSWPWLTHVELLPSVTEGKERHPAEVLVARVRAPGGGSFDPPLTIIDRWKVMVDQKQDLHPALLALGKKSGGAASELPPTTVLQPAEPLVVNKALVDVHTVPANSAKVLVLTYADGSIEYRDRWSLEEIYTQPTPERLATLKQAGFEMERQDECLQVAFSPTECSVVQLTDNHKLVWNRLRYAAGDLGTTRKEAPFAATVAALTVTLSGAIGHNNNFDDVLAIMRLFGGGPAVWSTVINEMVRMNKAYLDYDQLEPDAALQGQQPHQQQPAALQQQNEVLQNGVLGACLSLIAHMGFWGEYKVRPHAGQMASLVLMAKCTAVAATIGLTVSKSSQRINPFDEPESVEVFAGNAKWALDLYSWIVASIEDLRRDGEFMAMLVSRERSPQLHQYLASKGQPVIHYMLCSATRGILSSLARRMGLIMTYAAQAAEFIRKNPGGRPQTPLQVAYQEMHRVAEESPVKLADFLLLANLFATECREKYRAYRAGALNLAQQQARDSQTPFNAKRVEDTLRQRVSDIEVNFMLGGPIAQPWTYALQGVMKQFPAFLDGTYVPPAQAATPQQPLPQPSSAVQQQQHQQLQPAPLPPAPTATGRVMDRSKLFTWNYDLVALPQRATTLQRWERNRRHVDMFRRIAITGPPQGIPAGMPPPPASDRPEAKPPSSVMMDTTRWRRCTRCAGVMQNMHVPRPGHQTLMKMQMRCPCGGNWALLDRGQDSI